MENKLEIKYRNQRQSFEILEDEIVVDLNTAKHKLKYNIPFEEIKKNWSLVNGTTDIITNRLMFSLFLNGFLILLLIVIVNNAPINAIRMIVFMLTLPFVFLSIKNNQKYEEKHIDCPKHLFFIYTKKNAKEVDKFVELVYQKQIEFFRRKYFLIDPILPYNTQYERFIWLYTNKYINENEYEVIKEDLDKYFNFNPTE